jgi:hypothetical protein
MNLAIFSTGESTLPSSYLAIKKSLIYWTLALSKAFLKITVESYLELTSNHSLIFTVDSKIIIKDKPYTLYNAKNGPIFRS